MDNEKTIEIKRKCEEIITKTTNAFDKIQKEYNLKNFVFTGVCINQKGIDWVTTTNYDDNNKLPPKRRTVWKGG